MINTILNGLISFITAIGQVYTAPVNALLTNVFPDITNYLNVITSVLNLIGGVLAWFFSLVPPITRGIILAIIYFWLGVWPLRVVVWNVQLGLDFIKRINIFSSK